MKRRDHALFTAFAPYKNPRYAISVVIEHGGTGSSGAAPIAKKVIKKVLDRHQVEKKYQLRSISRGLKNDKDNYFQKDNLSFRDKIFALDFPLIFLNFIIRNN